MVDGTELVNLTVGTCQQALSAFGNTVDGSVRLPIVCTPTRASFPFVSIPQGVYAIMQDRGVNSKQPMKPGLHFLLPWQRVAYVITPQYTQFDIPIKDCPTKDNVMVKIDVFMVFRIFDPIVFIEQLSPPKLGDLLRAAQEEAVRNLARSRLHSEIYDLVKFDEEEITKELDQKFRKYGVEVASMMLTDVKLPREIGERLQNETTFQSKNRLQKRKQDFELFQQSNQQRIAKRELEIKNMKLAFSEECKRSRAEIDKEIDELEARTRKIVAETEVETKRQVSAIDEEAKKHASQLREDKDAALLGLRAQSQAKKDALLAETFQLTEQVRSSAQVRLAEAQAESVKMLANAEREASEKLKARREYDVKQRRLAVTGGLAGNADKVIVSGSSGGNLVAELVASSEAFHLFDDALKAQ